jgi:hypothetical protein
MALSNNISRLFTFLLSENRKEQVERATLVVAIFSFLLHLFIIFLNTYGVLDINQKFFRNPIAAIYTPFSFILIFEVFLLVYYLPKSITAYIGKQYEIIALIVIRRIFKDLAYVDLTSNWFQNQDDLQFTLDVLTSLILFFLIYLFYRAVKKRNYSSIHDSNKRGRDIRRFVLLKRVLSIVLVPTLFIFAVYTFFNWGILTFQDYRNGILEFSNINSVFFDEFFTILIIVDVLLLLASFFYSDEFHKIIRNSGFVISTILLKISFLSTGIVSNLLVIGAVLFGYLMLRIHNLYENQSLEIEE